MAEGVQAGGNQDHQDHLAHPALEPEHWGLARPRVEVEPGRSNQLAIMTAIIKDKWVENRMASDKSEGRQRKYQHSLRIQTVTKFYIRKYFIIDAKRESWEGKNSPQV